MGLSRLILRWLGAREPNEHRYYYDDIDTQARQLPALKDIEAATLRLRQQVQELTERVKKLEGRHG